MARKKAARREADEAAGEDTATILVPVDFSDTSKEALTFAARLSRSIGMGLLVLHVVHDPGDAPGYYHVKGRKKHLGRLQDVAAEMLDHFVAELVAKNPDLEAIASAERLTVMGLPVTRILEVVERRRPAMVVMGSEGRTGLSHLLLGSKAEQVVQLCPVPVTIVKRPRTGKARSKSAK